MKKEQRIILDLMKQDPLSDAEKITGKSYKEDEGTEAIGMLLHLEKNAALTALLKQAGDTTWGMSVLEYIEVITKFGFQQVYIEPFVCDNRKESLYIFFHVELSILLSFDTFNGSSVNSGHFYYNWSPNMDLRGRLTSTGGFFFPKDGKHIGLFERDLYTPYEIQDYPKSIVWEDSLTWEEFKEKSSSIQKMQNDLIRAAEQDGKRCVWGGYHDAREGIITTIKNMYENGKFLPRWVDCPFPWLTHYADHKNSDRHYPFTDLYNVTHKRIEQLPDVVKICINNTYQKM